MLPPLLFAHQRHNFNALSLRDSSAFALPASSQSPQVGSILILASIELGIDVPITVNTVYEAGIDVLSLPVDQIAEQTSVAFRRLYTSLLSIQRQNIVKFLIRPTLRSLRLSISNTISTPQRSVLHYVCHGLDSQPATGSFLLYDDNVDTTSRQAKIQLISPEDIIKIVGDHVLFVLDCSYAGAILNSLRDIGILETDDNILALAATSSTERLPLWVSSLSCYPVDIFTQCLLNPMKMYIFLYVRKMCHTTSSPCTYEQCDAVYTYLQHPSNRDFFNGVSRVLKLVCEAIAWSSLPRDVFNRLYRQDKCVSTLFTGFILAQRIMSSIRLTAQSLPPLPDTTGHRLWELLDSTFNTHFMEFCTTGAKVLTLSVFNFYFERRTPKEGSANVLQHETTPSKNNHSCLTSRSLAKIQNKSCGKENAWQPGDQDLNLHLASGASLTGRAPSKGTSISSTANQSFIQRPAKEPTSSLMVSFLQDQLRAFELWFLNMSPSIEVPDVLPFVIVSIKIQQLRSKALELIMQFIDMSPWCLRATLELRLLQTILQGIYTFHECEVDQYRCILILCKILVANYSVIPLIVNPARRNSGSGATASKGNIEDVLCDILAHATTSADMRVLCLITLTCLVTDQAIADAHFRTMSTNLNASSIKDTAHLEGSIRGTMSTNLNSSVVSVYKSISASLANGFGFYTSQNTRSDDPVAITECCVMVRDILLKKNMLAVLIILTRSASEHVKLWSLLLMAELIRHLTATQVDVKNLRSNCASSTGPQTYKKTISASNSMVFTSSSSNLFNTSSRMISLTFLPDQMEQVPPSLRSADELILSAHDNFSQPNVVITYSKNSEKIYAVYEVLPHLLEPGMTAEIRAAAVSVVTASFPAVDLASIVVNHRVVDIFCPANVFDQPPNSTPSADPSKGVNITPPYVLSYIIKIATQDISPLVRHEALCSFAKLIPLYFQSFLALATLDLIKAYKMDENSHVRIFNGFHSHKIHYLLQAVYDALKQAMYDPVTTISIRARQIFDSISALALCILLQTTPVTDDFFHINCRKYLEQQTPSAQLQTTEDITTAVKHVFAESNMRKIKSVLTKLSLVRNTSNEQIEHILLDAMSAEKDASRSPRTMLKLSDLDCKTNTESTSSTTKVNSMQVLSVNMCLKHSTTSIRTPDNKAISAPIRSQVSDASLLSVPAVCNKNSRPSIDSSGTSDNSDLMFDDINSTLDDLTGVYRDRDSSSRHVSFVKAKIMILQELDEFWLQISVRMCIPYILASLLNCTSGILTLSRKSIRFPSTCFNIEMAAAVAAHQAHRSLRMCPMHSLMSIKDTGASYYRMHNTCCTCGRPAMASYPYSLHDYTISATSASCLTIEPQVASIFIRLTKLKTEQNAFNSPTSYHMLPVHSGADSLNKHQQTYSDLTLTDAARSTSLELEETAMQMGYKPISLEAVSSAMQAELAKEKKSLWPSLFDLQIRKLSEFDHKRLQSYFLFLKPYLKKNRRRASLLQDALLSQSNMSPNPIAVTDATSPGFLPSSYYVLDDIIFATSFNSILSSIGESYLYAVKTNAKDMRRLSPCTPMVFVDNSVSVNGIKEQEKVHSLSNNKTSLLSLISHRLDNSINIGNSINFVSGVKTLLDHHLLQYSDAPYWDAKIEWLFESPANLLTLLTQGANNTNLGTQQYVVNEIEHLHVVNHLCYFCRNLSISKPLLEYCKDALHTWMRRQKPPAPHPITFHLTRDVNTFGFQGTTSRDKEQDDNNKVRDKGYAARKGANESRKLLKGKNVSRTSRIGAIRGHINVANSILQSKLQTIASPFPYLEQLAYCRLSQEYFENNIGNSAAGVSLGYLVPYVCSVALFTMFFDFSNYFKVSLADPDRPSVSSFKQHNIKHNLTIDNPVSIVQEKRNFLMEIHGRIISAINDVDYDRLSDSLNKVWCACDPERSLMLKSITVQQQNEMSSGKALLPILSESSMPVIHISSSDSKSVTQGSKIEEAIDTSSGSGHQHTRSHAHKQASYVNKDLFALDMMPKVDSCHSMGSETISMSNMCHHGTSSQMFLHSPKEQEPSTSNEGGHMTDLDLYRQLHTRFPEQNNYLGTKFLSENHRKVVQEALKKGLPLPDARLQKPGLTPKASDNVTVFKKVKSIAHDSGPIKHIVFHKNEAILITSNGSSCCVWNTLTGELLNKIPLDTFLDIQTTSWPGGGLLSGHVHTPKFTVPQPTQSHSLMNLVSDNCLAPEAAILANMLNADALSLECAHCSLLNASRSRDYNVLKHVGASLTASLEGKSFASAEDVEQDVLERLFPLVKSSNAYDRMIELVRNRRGPYVDEAKGNFIGNIALLNQYVPHSVLAAAAADGTVRILTNYHDASLCRHVSAFNVRLPSTEPLFSSVELQRAPFSVVEFYRHKFNADIRTPDTKLSHHRKQYIISRSKICNALFYDKKKPDDWVYTPELTACIPILKGYANILNHYTAAPHLVTCMPNSVEMNLIDLVHESVCLRLQCTHQIQDLVPICLNGFNCGVLAYGNKEYSLFDFRSKRPIMEARASANIVGAELYDETVFLATSGGVIESCNIVTEISHCRYSIDDTEHVLFHPSGLFACMSSALQGSTSAPNTNTLTGHAFMGHISDTNLGSIQYKTGTTFTSQAAAFHPTLPLLAIPNLSQVALWSL